MTTSIFTPADILVPDPSKCDLTKWATIACDQYTLSPEYWNEVERFVGDSPSTFRLTLSEIYLGNDDDERILKINIMMYTYLCDEIFIKHPDSFFYIERTLANSRIRRGIIGKIDLESYNYTADAQSPIRATEQTVVERIPPRVKIRSGAALELPHLMLLIDDPERRIIEPLEQITVNENLIYDFKLMQNAGSIRAFKVPEEQKAPLQAKFDELSAPGRMRRRYGDAATGHAPLAFAVGDGNHSLAAAKEFYNETKKQLGERAASHPARYALAEVVNLYDNSLEFEPIYRVLTDIDIDDLQNEMTGYFHDKLKHSDLLTNNNYDYSCICIELVHAGGSVFYNFKQTPELSPVSLLQPFLDKYIAERRCGIDYIHGENTAREIGMKPNCAAFIFKCMGKSELFPSVISGGVLPRKSFSMGEADDKRFYIECRKIVE